MKGDEDKKVSPLGGCGAKPISGDGMFGLYVSTSELTMYQEPPAFIKTVEWDMLDKKKFFPMSMLSSFTVRTFLYPLTLIRTRLQVQHHKDVYSGTFDAARKIFRSEGVSGFYRGFWVSAFQVVSGTCYVSTYEGVRHILDSRSITNNDKVKAFVGGACASIVGQTIIVPFDVISQHMMLIGQRAQAQQPQFAADPQSRAGENLRDGRHVAAIRFRTEGLKGTAIAREIVTKVYATDGFRGFYRGYLSSLCTYVPSSASWWAFYHLFQDVYGALLPAGSVVPLMALQCAAAVSSGCASSLITNPLDVVRTRVQVQRQSIPDTVRYLWRSEGVKFLTKGLSARMSASSLYSLAIIFGYETVKRWSVLDQYKDRIVW